MQPLVVAPQRITESTPLRDEDRGEVGAEEARGALLHDHRLVLRGSSRGSISAQWPAELQVAERRHLLHPEAAVLEARLEGDRGEDDRQPLRAGRVEQPPRRLDLRRQVGAERARGIGEPAREVDDEHGGARAERDALPQPRPGVDLACLLVAHAGTATRPRREELLADARALDELARTRLADELVALDDHLAAHEHDLRGALYLSPLEQVVVDVGVVRGGGDRQLLVGIPDDDVGVGARRDRALARVEPEPLRDVRRDELDESVQRDAALAHAEVQQHVQPVLDARAAVRDHLELLAVDPLLLRPVERAVVGRDRRRARLRRAPSRGAPAAPSAAAAACRCTSRPRSPAARAPCRR